MIRFVDTTKVYSNGVVGLKNLTVRIEKGEFVAIVGPSGSGKSTSMNIIGCLDVPTAGEYLFQGVPTSGFDNEHLTLLRAANWRTVDRHSIESVLREGDRYWPMPYIDGKRPYGNSSHYQIDMARLLGEPYPIDAKGRVAAQLAPLQAGVLPVSVQGMTGLTPYARFGDKTALALIGLALIAAVGSARRPRRG
mgnify:CR=1 FL=1